jgi:hypothetical protein
VLHNVTLRRSHSSRNEDGFKEERNTGTLGKYTVIADLNPVLRGWGEYFRTGNAALRFNQLDTYVWRRLRALRLPTYRAYFDWWEIPITQAEQGPF